MQCCLRDAARAVLFAAASAGAALFAVGALFAAGAVLIVLGAAASMARLLVQYCLPLFLQVTLGCYSCSMVCSSLLLVVQYWARDAARAVLFAAASAAAALFAAGALGVFRLCLRVQLRYSVAISCG